MTEVQDTTQPERGSETLGDPALIEADAALKAADSKETKDNKTIRIQMLDNALQTVNARLDIVQRTEPDNFDKLKRLTDRQLRLTQKREELVKTADATADASMREVGDEMKVYGESLDANVKRMQELAAEKTKLETDLAAIQGSNAPEDIAKKAEIYAKLEANQAEMTALQEQGSLEDQEKKAEVARQIERKAHEMTEAEHKEQSILADTMLQEFTDGAEPEKDAPPAESEAPKKTPFSDQDFADQVAALDENTTLADLQKKVAEIPKDSTDPKDQKLKEFVGALETAEVKPEMKVKEFLADKKNQEKVMGFLKEADTARNAQRKKLFNNFVHQSCSDLATEMASHPPKEDDSIGWTFFEMKRVGLMIASAFAGNAWVENLNAKERAALSMEVTETQEEGRTKYKIKWNKIDKGLLGSKDVLVEAFGEKDWAEQMKGLTPDTKLSDLQKQVAAFPKDTKDAKQLKMKAFVKALETAAGPGNDPKIQEFLATDGNAEKVKASLIKPVGAAPTAEPGETEAAVDEDTESAPKLKDYLKVIEENHLSEKSNVAQLFQALSKSRTPDSLSLIATMSSETIDRLKVTPDFTEAKLKELYAIINNEGVSHGFKSLGINPVNFSKELYEKALAEITTGEKKLTPETQTKLEETVKQFLQTCEAFATMPLKDYISKLSEGATGDDLKTRDAILAALKKNNPTE